MEKVKKVRSVKEKQSEEMRQDSTETSKMRRGEQEEVKAGRGSGGLVRGEMRGVRRTRPAEK